MNNKEQHTTPLNINDESGKTSDSLALNNTNLHDSENFDINHSVLKHNDSIQGTSDPVKYLDLQRMFNEQKNTMMVLKLSAYEKALNERDHTIKSMHTEMMNNQNDSYVISRQYQSIMEKTNYISDTCISLNTKFTNICERLNRLGDIVDNAKVRQNDVMILVNQTTNTFQQKVLNISDSIDDSLKQMNIEKIRIKQELEVLNNNYSRDISVYKTDLEKCMTEMEHLKSKNNALLDKCNESIIKLNEEKETALKLNQQFEKELNDKEKQNKLLTDDNMSISIKLDEILNENQTLKNEIDLMKTSLDENKQQLSMQSILVKEQTELLENLKVSVELNDVLKKDNLVLKERNEHLEKINHDIMEDINKNELFQNKIQEEKEKQFKEMCNNYDELLNMQGEKIIDLTETLKLQKEKENQFQNQIIELEQEVNESNNTIINLQDDLKSKLLLLPDLQHEIEDLKTKLAKSQENSNITAKKFLLEKNELEKDKKELENRNKDYCKQIEKLNSNYIGYKSKSKLLYNEVMRLRSQCSRSDQKKTPRVTLPLENIEDDDVIIIDKDIPNQDVSIWSTSKKISLKSNSSNSKRNSSPLKYVDNSKIKKQKITADIIPQQEIFKYNKHLKENQECKNINSINSVSNTGSNLTKKNEFKKLSVKHQGKLKPINEQNIEYSKPNSPVILTPAPSNIMYMENVFRSNC